MKNIQKIIFYHCRNDLKNYFNLIDFAQDFD